MLPLHTHQLDADLIPMFAKNDPSVWEHIYDQYAPLMYGTILNLTRDEAIAGELLEQAFLDLKRNNILLRISTTICHKILRHTYKLTINHLKTIGLAPSKTPSPHENMTHIDLFYFEGTSLKDAAKSTNLTEQEVKTNLRAEVNYLRNLKK